MEGNVLGLIIVIITKELLIGYSRRVIAPPGFPLRTTPSKNFAQEPGAS